MKNQQRLLMHLPMSIDAYLHIRLIVLIFLLYFHLPMPLHREPTFFYYFGFVIFYRPFWPIITLFLCLITIVIYDSSRQSRRKQSILLRVVIDFL